MKAKDIFNLAVRLLGLFFIYLAASQVPILFIGISSKIFFTVILSTAFYVGIAWWLLGGAKILLDCAYPEADDQKRSGEAEKERIHE